MNTIEEAITVSTLTAITFALFGFGLVFIGYIKERPFTLDVPLELFIPIVIILKVAVAHTFQNEN